MAEKEHKVLDIVVLYVEDDEQTRKGIVEYLSLRVSKVHAAENGRVAYDIYKNTHPGVIITDIKMPEMNGLELTRKVRELDTDTPFIITTAYNEVDYLLESIELGVNQFILKPVLGTKLMEAIEKCMHVDTLEKELVHIAALLTEYKNAIDISSIVSKFDIHGEITYGNEALSRISGYPKEELIGMSFDNLRYQAQGAELFSDIWNRDTSKKTWRGEMKCRKKNGSIYYVNATIVPISDYNNTIIEYMFIAYEITELIQKKEELYQELYSDRVTGLYNRKKLLEDVETSANPSLMLINVDNFQQLNDFYGNEIGDFVIQEIAQRLGFILKDKGCSLYKMPADEYAVLIDRDIHRSELETIMSQVREEISEKDYHYNENLIHITVAVGIALSSDIKSVKMGSSKWHSLILNADMALKRAKKLQKHYIVFHDSMQITKEYESNIHWTLKLKEAIKEDRIIPYFQPIMNNHTHRFEKYECLVRMVDTDGRINPPMLFLDIAKKAKLYHDITKIMLVKALDTFRNTEYEFSVNLSVNDILDEETNHFIKKTMEKNYRVVPRMVFEILESEGIENYEEVKSFIDEMKGFQCKIAIDDFGTGYSNFSHILQLNVDYIKIDASLTKHIAEDLNAQIITETIVNFTKKLNIRTIAEFVHSREVFEKIMGLGVDYSQGYYFGEPKDSI